AAGAPGVDGGEQRRLAGQTARLGCGGGVVEVEHLVVDGDDLPPAGAQVAPAPDALGRGGGGRVERPGGGRPPVHQERLVLVLLVQQAQPADVAALAVLGVEAAEREPVLGGAQRREAVGVHRGRGVPLGERLRRADRLVVQDVREPAGGLGAARVEALVQHADVGPLVLDPVVEQVRLLVRDAGIRPRGGRAVRHRQITFAGVAYDRATYERTSGRVSARRPAGSSSRAPTPCPHAPRACRRAPESERSPPRTDADGVHAMSDTARHSDYAHLAPLFEEFAALPPDHPERQALRAKLVTGYLPVVQHIARRFAVRGRPVDGLDLAGTVGLLNAVDRVEPDRGIDFLSYAVPTITGEIRRQFRDRTWSMRVPRRLKDLQSSINGAVGPLSQELGRA